MCSPMRKWIWPVGERVRHRLRGGYGSWCRGEGEEERVSLGVHLDAALITTRLPDDAAVLGELLRVRLRAELMQEPRRALHIGEEEGDGAGREILAHAPSSSARSDHSSSPIRRLWLEIAGCGGSSSDHRARSRQASRASWFPGSRAASNPIDYRDGED